jgi:O-acetyl-ADP-ribose deacetylase (regulator of RNase III)
MQAAIYTGDITTVPADVVCTSTNPHLDLVLGTGGAIREAAGESVQEECRAVIAREYQRTHHRYLRQGTAVRTTAGRLPFRALIHCVAIDAFHGSTPETIAACTRNALREAAALDPPPASIAMPVFASGNGRFDFERGLNIMLDELFRPGAPTPPKVVFFTRHADQANLAAHILSEKLGTVEVPSS